MPRTLRFALVLCFASLALAECPAQTVPAGGALLTADNHSVPLKHTRVEAGISGFLARVNVTQEFVNDAARKIEAVYVFPLPSDAAVDDMTITVGQQTIRGQIRQREVARKIYDAARRRGNVAALLDQERPNIFTQSVANIEPGAAVTVTISYVEVLRYDAGAYEFVFPTVVGERYLPGSMTATAQGAARAARVNPARELRPGHDISIAIALDAGVAINDFSSPSHAVDAQRTGVSTAIVRLQNAAEIPNRDFILRYEVAGEQIQDAVLTHRAPNGDGFFMLMLQPPERFPEWDVNPKELVFVLDTSGSMSGFPIEKAKEAMQHALDALYSFDTFNLITFAGDTHVLFEEPVPATPENLAKAKAFLETRAGSGGTEMMKAIRTALKPSERMLAAGVGSDPRGGGAAVGVRPLRVVCFMTDGYVGNDMEIIGEIQKNPHARVFAFGIGDSVNRFLLDGMARAGRGEVEYVGLDDDGSLAARRFHERVRAPLLTDLEVDFGGLQVTDVYPARPPDLFSAKPVVIFGRYTQPARGTVTLRGYRAGAPWTQSVRLDLPAAQPRHASIAKLWARTHIDALMARDWKGVQERKLTPELEAQITRIGLEYRLMTQFTSFVAVAEEIITVGGQPMLVDVPAAVPRGVRPEQQGAGFDSLALLSPGMVNSNGSVVNYVTKSGSNTFYSADEEVIGFTSSQVVDVEGTAPLVESTSSQISTTFGPNFPSIEGTPGVWNPSTSGLSPAYTTPPFALRTPPPGYPDEVRLANPTGVVRVQFEVLPDGTVGEVKLKKSLAEELDRRALETVKLWQFRAAERNGKPVKVRLEADLTFSERGVNLALRYGRQALPVPNPRTDLALLTVDARERLALEDKLAPDLAELYFCWKRSQKTGEQCASVEDGNLAVHIWLAENSAADGLQAAGFVERFRTAAGPVGTVPIAAVAKLVLLDAVTTITAPPTLRPVASSRR